MLSHRGLIFSNSYSLRFDDIILYTITNKVESAANLVDKGHK
jgi:hypothetical protein